MTNLDLEEMIRNNPKVDGQVVREFKERLDSGERVRPQPRGTQSPYGQRLRGHAEWATGADAVVAHRPYYRGL